MHRRKRQLQALEDAKQTRDLNRAAGYTGPFGTGITIQREGGRGYNKDLRQLVELGLLRMIRRPYSKGWGGNYDLNVTILEITEAGEAALENGKINA